MKVKLAEFENAVARYLDAALCEPVEISTEERNHLVLISWDRVCDSAENGRAA